MNYERTARISLLAAEMAILFTPGHKALQTPEYEAKRAEYLQELVNKQWEDYSDPPPIKDYRTCG